MGVRAPLPPPRAQAAKPSSTFGDMCPVRNRECSQGTAVWDGPRSFPGHGAVRYGREPERGRGAGSFPCDREGPWGAVREGRGSPWKVRTRTCVHRRTTLGREGDVARRTRGTGPAVSSCGAGVRPQWHSSRTGDRRRSGKATGDPRRGEDFRPPVVVAEVPSFEERGGGDLVRGRPTRWREPA